MPDRLKDDFGQPGLPGSHMAFLWCHIKLAVKINIEVSNVTELCSKETPMAEINLMGNTKHTDACYI